MTPSVSFGDFPTVYKLYRAGMSAALTRIEQNLPPEKLYPIAAKLLPETAPELKLEGRWHGAGAPEYRLFPPALAALEKTRLDVPVKHVRFPFEVFVVRLPRGVVRESVRGAPACEAIMASIFKEEPLRRIVREGHDNPVIGVPVPGAPPIWKCHILGAFDVRDGVDAPDKFNGVKFPLETDALGSNPVKLPKDPTFEQALTHVPLRHEDGVPLSPQERLGYWPSREFFIRLGRIVLGTAFIAIGRDRKARVPLVEEAALPRKERRHRELGREAPARTLDVGRRLLSLPHATEERPPTELAPEDVCVRDGCGHAYAGHGRGKCPAEDCGCPAFDTGRHLTSAHVRCGHLHWYATGTRASPSYVLRWVDPTIVRPDLPFAAEAHAPYAIRDAEGLDSRAWNPGEKRK